MYIEIYLDVVFAINVIMDFIIITIECKLLGRKVPLKRKFFGAVFGGITMCIIIIIPVLSSGYKLILTYILISGGIGMIVFMPKNLLELLKLTGIMYFIAIVLGGLMFFLFYYTRIGFFINDIGNKKTFLQFTIGELIVYLAIAFFLVLSLLELIKRSLNAGRKMYQVKLVFRGKEKDVNAMLDTGNNLFDPITKVPVVVVEKEVVKDFFEDREYKDFEDLMVNLNILDTYNEKIQSLVKYNIRLIPYNSIGNENGMLIGIVSDKVSVKVGKGYKEYEKIVLAIYNKKLCGDNSYNMLLHPSLIYGG